MLTALNTKLLIAILAAVTFIGSIVAYDHHKAAEAAAVLQKQHQQEVDYQNQVDRDFQKARKNNTNPANEADTLDHYVP